MKRVEAIVKTSQLEPIVDRLRLIGVTGMTLAEVHGVSASTAFAGVSQGQRYRPATTPRYMLTIVLPDDDAAHVVRAIVHAGRTEKAGDGIVTVSDVIEAVRIRTGESGPDAL